MLLDIIESWKMKVMFTIDVVRVCMSKDNKKLLVQWLDIQVHTFRNGVFIELIADQGRLELGAEETVSITTAIQHHEVEGKY